MRPLTAALITTSLLALASRAGAAPAPPPAACGTDDECLDKLFVTTVKSKVKSVVDAAQLTTAADKDSVGASVQRARARVASWRGSGLDVVAPADVPLGDGTVLLALDPADAATLVAGGLFRRIG